MPKNRISRPPSGRAVVIVGPGADYKPTPVAPSTPDEVADDLVTQLAEAAF